MDEKTAYRKALNLIKRSNWLIASAIDSNEWPDNAFRINYANPKRFPVIAKHINYKIMENYFPIHKYSSRWNDLQARPKATLYYYDVTTGEICQLHGVTREVKDPHIKAALFHKDWETQFPDGPTDEDYVLLRFEMKILKYYDGVSDSFIGKKGTLGLDKKEAKNAKVRSAAKRPVAAKPGARAVLRHH